MFQASRLQPAPGLASGAGDKHRLSTPYQNYLRPQLFKIWGFLLGVQIVCTDIMSYLGVRTWNSFLFAYAPDTQCLKVILCNTLNNFAHETKLRGMEFSWYGHVGA